jgi:hypothetical protein
MRNTMARISQLLWTGYEIELDPQGASVNTVQLGELDLDSLALLSFLADIEREFRLRSEELAQIARRDCTFGSLSALCRTAAMRI